MKPYYQSKRILLIDQQSHWREVSSHALRSVGFEVSTLDTYNYLVLQDCLHDENPNLVVLGCLHIESEEQRLITQILTHKYHLIVLCASIPSQMMRSLFLQGVDDIVDKSYDSVYFVNIVSQALESTTPRNSYQAVERGSLS